MSRPGQISMRGTRNPGGIISAESSGLTPEDRATMTALAEFLLEIFARQQQLSQNRNHVTDSTLTRKGKLLLK